MVEVDDLPKMLMEVVEMSKQNAEGCVVLPRTNLQPPDYGQMPDDNGGKLEISYHITQDLAETLDIDCSND